MKITRSQLKKLIKEAMNSENIEHNKINESIFGMGAMAKSLWGKTSSAREVRSKAKSGQKEIDRASSSENVLQFISTKFSDEASSSAKSYAVKFASNHQATAANALRTISAVEFAAISFALGIPMLTVWSLNRGMSPEGQLRNLRKMAGRPLFFTGWRVDDNGERTEKGRISDPFGEEYKQTYHATEDHPIVEIIENQELAHELYEDEIIGDEIMNWARGWWRDIANAKAEYLREKREALKLAAIGMDDA